MDINNTNTDVNNTTGCLICGESLVYFDTAKEMRCVICGKTFEANVCCQNGHYICDECHAAPAEAIVRSIATNAASTNAIDIATQMMMAPSVHMHGPEHHFIVGSALLRAFVNAGGFVSDFNTALDAIIARGKMVPGGFCGLAGCCGAAVSAGIFYSVIKKTTPLSKEGWSVGMRMTASCLNKISNHGGPRCCKRDTFLSIIAAAEFLRENDGVIISNNTTSNNTTSNNTTSNNTTSNNTTSNNTTSNNTTSNNTTSSNTTSNNDKITCQFSKQNHECLKEKCPFYV